VDGKRSPVCATNCKRGRSLIPNGPGAIRTRDLLLRRRGPITSKFDKLLSFLDGARDHAGLSCLNCRLLPGYLESKLESSLAGRSLLCEAIIASIRLSMVAIPIPLKVGRASGESLTPELFNLAVLPQLFGGCSPPLHPAAPGSGHNRRHRPACGERPPCRALRTGGAAQLAWHRPLARTGGLDSESRTQFQSIGVGKRTAGSRR